MTPDMDGEGPSGSVAGDGHGCTSPSWTAGAEQLPFADASFDVVISNGVIDLIPDKDAVLAGDRCACCGRAAAFSSPTAPSNGRV